MRSLFRKMTSKMQSQIVTNQMKLGFALGILIALSACGKFQTLEPKDEPSAKAQHSGPIAKDQDCKKSDPSVTPKEKSADDQQTSPVPVPQKQGEVAPAKPGQVAESGQSVNSPQGELAKDEGMLLGLSVLASFGPSYERFANAIGVKILGASLNASSTQPDGADKPVDFDLKIKLLTKAIVQFEQLPVHPLQSAMASSENYKLQTVCAGDNCQYLFVLILSMVQKGTQLEPVFLHYLIFKNEGQNKFVLRSIDKGLPSRAELEEYLTKSGAGMDSQLPPAMILERKFEKLKSEKLKEILNLARNFASTKKRIYSAQVFGTLRSMEAQVIGVQEEAKLNLTFSFGELSGGKPETKLTQKILSQQGSRSRNMEVTLQGGKPGSRWGQGGLEAQMESIPGAPEAAVINVHLPSFRNLQPELGAVSSLLCVWHQFKNGTLAKCELLGTKEVLKSICLEGKVGGPFVVRTEDKANAQGQFQENPILENEEQFPNDP